MSPHHKLKIDITGSSSKTFLFRDNTTTPSVTSISAISLTKQDLNLSENAPDPEIFKKLEAYRGSNDDVIVITSDKGAVMRSTIKQYQQGNILVITTSVKGARNQQIAENALFNTHGFKNHSNLVKWYSKINLSQSGSDLHIDYIDKRGKYSKTRSKIKKNVF